MSTTTCTTCGKLYQESSEERANAPERECMDCWAERRYRDAVTGADQRATSRLIEGLKRTQ